MNDPTPPGPSDDIELLLEHLRERLTSYQKNPMIAYLTQRASEVASIITIIEDEDYK